MYLQDTLSRFRRPGLHKIGPSCPRGECVDSHPLRFTKSRTAELSVHSTIVPGEHLHNVFHWSLVAILSQAPPTSAISSDSPELKQTMFSFLEDAHTGYHVFSAEHVTQTAIPE